MTTDKYRAEIIQKVDGDQTAAHHPLNKDVIHDVYEQLTDEYLADPSIGKLRFGVLECVVLDVEFEEYDDPLELRQPYNCCAPFTKEELERISSALDER